MKVFNLEDRRQAALILFAAADSAAVEDPRTLIGAGSRGRDMTESGIATRWFYCPEQARAEARAEAARRNGRSRALRWQAEALWPFPPKEWACGDKVPDEIGEWRGGC